IGGGFAGLALIDLLSRDGYFAKADDPPVANSPGSPLAPREPHFPARAKHAIFLFMNGAPSQVDTFDPKPALTRLHGTAYRGDTLGSASNWTAGYMPAAYQGTLFRSQGNPLIDLATPPGTSERTQRDALDLLGRLNQQHQAARPGDSELAARIESYELAYRMQ